MSLRQCLPFQKNGSSNHHLGRRSGHLEGVQSKKEVCFAKWSADSLPHEVSRTTEIFFGPPSMAILKLEALELALK